MRLTRLRSQGALTAILSLTVFTFAFADGFFGGLLDVCGPRFSYDGRSPLELLAPPRTTRQPGSATNAVRYWNQVTLDANAIDHTPPGPDESRVFGEQLGPGRTALAFAIVHVAIFEAVNAVTGGYTSYTGLEPAPAGTSIEAAVAQAAHDTLAAEYPSQAPRFDDLLANDLAQLPDDDAKQSGIDLGGRAAASILALRVDDGSQYQEPRLGEDFFTSDEPGKWRQDPIAQSPLALGAYWGSVTPLVLSWSGQFRAPAPPALTSTSYTVAFNEVKQVGGDGVTTPTLRLPDQTFAAIYWGYDGTPGLGTPPRMFNQIVVQLATARGSTVAQLARLLALVNVAMADAGIACWESKFYYQFWRPVTAIRESDYTLSLHDALPIYRKSVV